MVENRNSMPETPDLLPARMLNEFAYCPRLYYLEWIQSQFVESADTLEGQFAHRRVRKEEGAVPEGAETEKIHARSVYLSAPRVGLTAKLDLLEGEGGKVVPVDYKHGSVPDNPEKSWEPERVQLCAQGIILRENGFDCQEGALYFVQSKQRVTVQFSEVLVKRTLELLSAAREVAGTETIPLPLIDSPKCPRCSLVGVCLPDEVNLLSGERIRVDDVRRLIPAMDDALPLYLQEHGLVLGKKGDNLAVLKSGKSVQEVRLLEVSQVCLFGNIQVSVQALRALCERGIPICYFSFGGWFFGITHGLIHKNAELRIRQFRVASDSASSLTIARSFVEGKIRNQRTMLRRNFEGCPQPVLDELSRLSDLTALAPSLDTLIGIEGAAAQLYFANFSGMLKSGATDFDFNERNRRPPTDPVNALLSLLYSILAKDLTITAMAVGFDPYIGFLHRPRYGRPALALDLMEEFRAIICDSVVIAVLNTGEVQLSDFIQRGPAVALTEDGRRKLIKAYERRRDTLVSHPIFGYTISYRRIMEVQTRLLARHLAGELPNYSPFCTR
jgi:CRISPR-associated protein Cas1